MQVKQKKDQYRPKVRASRNYCLQPASHAILEPGRLKRPEPERGIQTDSIINVFNTSQPNWMVGYLWRYLGDGGFMGMAFTVGYCALKPRVDSRIAGLGFGVAIWLCLIGTLVLAPHGQEMLFRVTAITLSLSLLGHLIYGAAIGILLPYVCRKELTGVESIKLAILSRDVWEEPLDNEATLKLPPLLRKRPVWEQKTATLALGS